jgi:hypothetical protein
MKRASRDRTFAVFDKKKSLRNYMKLDDENENKVEMIKRLTGGTNSIDINSINELNQEDVDIDLPKPPVFSSEKKIFSSDKSNLGAGKIAIHERATIFSSFDKYEVIDSELSLVNIENYFSKFDEDELNELKIKDILTFDLKEFDLIKEKLKEFQEVGKKLNDSEIDKFLEEKIKRLEDNNKNVGLLINNLEKVEDFVILNETLRFFFKKNKK